MNTNQINSVTQRMMNAVADEYTSRVHIVTNFIKEDGHNHIDDRDTSNLVTTRWIPYDVGIQRVVALACRCELF